MKGLLNLLILLAVAFNLTNGCGLAARRRAGPTILQLSSAVTGGSLGAGATGGNLASGVSALLGSSSGGNLLGGIGKLATGAAGTSIGVGGLDSSGAGSALGSIVSGLSGRTGGSLLTRVGSLAANHFSRSGSGVAVGSLPSITGSGGNTGILLGQGFQRSGQMVAGQILAVAGGVRTTAANSATSFGGTIAGNPPGNNIGLVSSQTRSHSVGFTSTAGGITTTDGPSTGGGPSAVSVPGAGITAGLLGGSGLGGLPGGGLPGSASSLGSVSSSSISASGISTVQRIGQTLQNTAQTLGTGPLAPGGMDITSAVASTAQHAGHAVGTYIGATGNPNGAGSGGRVPSGGTGPGSTATHPGTGFPAGPNQGQGHVRGVQPTDQLLGTRSFVVGTSSQQSTSSTSTNIHGNGVENGMNVEQGGRQQLPQIARPFPSGGAVIQAGTQIAGEDIRNSLNVISSLNGGGPRGSALSPGRAPVPGGPISGQSAGLAATNSAGVLSDIVGAATNSFGQGVSSSGRVTVSSNSILGQGPVRGVQPTDQLLGTRSFAVGTSSQQLTTSTTTNIQGNGVGTGMNVEQGVPQHVPQIDQPFPSGGAVIQAGTQIAGEAIRNSLNVVSSLNGGGPGGSALSPGRAPVPGGPISGQSAGLAATNSAGVLSDIVGAATNSFGQGVSSSGRVTVSSNSILGPGFPAGPNPRQDVRPVPVQDVRPTGHTLGGGSFVAGSSSHVSTTSTTTSIQGNGVGIGRTPGPRFGQGTQPANHVPGGGSVVSVSSSRHSHSAWGARIVQSSGGSLENGLPNLASGGPSGMPSTGPSGLGSTGSGSAATGGGQHGVHGAVPDGRTGVLGSSVTSVSRSSGVISGIGQGQVAQNPHGRKPSAAAAAGIALGVMAGTIALGAIGSGIAGAINSGMAGGGRRGGGCPRRACGGGCGRKRRSVPQSKVPAEVLNNIPISKRLGGIKRRR